MYNVCLSEKPWIYNNFQLLILTMFGQNNFIFNAIFKEMTEVRKYPILLKILLAWSYLVAKSYLTLLQPHGQQPTRLLCSRDFPGKNIGVGCHFLFQGMFPNQGSNPRLLHWQGDSLPLSLQGSQTGVRRMDKQGPTVYKELYSVSCDSCAHTLPVVEENTKKNVHINV